jgi:hypothetical protein
MIWSSLPDVLLFAGRPLQRKTTMIPNRYSSSPTSDYNSPVSVAGLESPFSGVALNTVAREQPGRCPVERRDLLTMRRAIRPNAQASSCDSTPSLCAVGFGMRERRLCELEREDADVARPVPSAAWRCE